MFTILVMATLAGCTTTRFMNMGGTEYPPYDGEVQVIDVHPEGVEYEVIGIVSAGGPWETSHEQLLQQVKEEAAQHGANAVMICSEQMGEEDSSLVAPAVRIKRRAPVSAPIPAQAPAPPVLAPAPAPAPTTTERALVEKGRVTLNIQFDTNMAVVKDHYFAELAELAAVMRKNPHLRVMIEGHTDSVGNDGFNQGLSQRRADAVKDFLARRFGIDAARLDAMGFGETRPIAGNDTPEGRQVNRRVEAAVEYEKPVNQ
jgi:OOP family OmpA-OmpF porin